MIIKQTSLTSIYKSLSLLNAALFALAFIVLSVFLQNFFWSTELEVVAPTKKITEEAACSRFDYNKMGEGALALNSEIQSFPFPDLSEEILFLGKNTRPDATLYDIKLHMGLRMSDQSMKVAPGQKLYLAYNEQQLSFAKDATPLFIKPFLDETGETWIEMGVRLVSDSGEVLLDETKAFQIEKSYYHNASYEPSDPLLSEGYEEMSMAKWWAPDRLYEAYGGESFSALTGRNRIEFERQDASYFLFVEEDDTLIWKEGTWVAAADTKGFPIARLRELSPYKMEWELWDETGLERTSVTPQREKVSGINLRIEEIFTRMRQRTTSRISCRIDNKAAILKKGDWILHTSTGWHILKNLKDVESALNFEVHGELFVFDGLEKVDGKPVFCGTLFDQMRTQTQSVRLPISQGKSKEHSPPTKKTISSKIRPASSDEETKDSQKRVRPRQKSRMNVEQADEYEAESEE